MCPVIGAYQAGLYCKAADVPGNPRVYKALKNQMAELYEELLYTLQLVAETLNGMKEDEE